MRLFSLRPLPALLALFATVHATQLGDLPGEDVSTSESAPKKSQPATVAPAPAPLHPNNWQAPSVDEQLSRDRVLIPLGKGALFVPAYTEPRREPEVTVYSRNGKEVISGQTGERILLDSGVYTVRFGSGTTGRRMKVEATVEEGHTTVVQPSWGGLIVETLDATGTYIEDQYEVIRMEKWINFGKGLGLTEERLQDIKVWTLPPGLYRVSKPGEGFSSLRNYITVQINPGELTSIELIYDKAGGDFISGGIKSLNTRTGVGRNWSYGLRAGGNLNFTREIDEANSRKEAFQVSSDLRLRVRYDNLRYFGLSEVFLQDNFAKEKGSPFSVTSDIAQARTTWVRRLNRWMGPYVGGTVSTNIFPKKSEQDTLYIVRASADPTRPGGVRTDTLATDSSGSFRVSPSFDPLEFREGVGVNVEVLSKYYLEASTQLGLAARQTVARKSYVASSDREVVQSVSLYQIGMENIVNAKVRLGSQATLDLRTEIFAPNANVTRFHLDDFTTDLRFFLSRNLELGYLFQMHERLQASAQNRFPRTHSLSLRLSFNY